MGRIHLFEFEDQKWFPTFLRDYGTDFLRFLANRTAMFKPVAPILARALRQTGMSRIVDLGSGGGGSWLKLGPALREKIPDIRIALTDKYPNLTAMREFSEGEGPFECIGTPVDARHVPSSLTGLRTMFLAFHHFRPGDAQQILRDAIDAGQPIAVFEAQERSLPSLLAMLLSPVTVLLVTPFIRPLRFGRFLFTYLLPVIPLFVLWDGVVSSLRTYSVSEMHQLVGGLRHADSYEWEVNRMRSGPGVILYLLGMPKNRVD